MLKRILALQIPKRLRALLQREVGRLLYPYLCSMRMVEAPSYHLLLVEDDADTVTLIRRIISRTPHMLMCATTCTEAIQIVHDDAFDVLLIDIGLPDGTGIDVLEHARNTSFNRTTPALALTAHALPGDRERLLRIGFDAYVAKPFCRHDVLSAVDMLC